MFRNKHPLYLALLLLLLPIAGYADFNLKPASLDLSYFILEIFYGKIDGVLHGQNAVLAKMFGIFNSVAIIISALIIIYIIIISTLNTANDGEMLGRKWSSMWVPIKLVAGFILLIPKASGYSIVQVIVMWIVVMGIGAADRVWETMVTHFSSGGSLIHAPVRTIPVASAEANLKFAANIFQAEVCTAALESVIRDNQDLVSKYQDTRQYLPSFLDSINVQNARVDSNGVYALEIPGEIKNFEYLKGKCGTITWTIANSADFCKTFQGTERSACIKYLDNNPQIANELQSNSSFKRAMPVAVQALINSLKSTAKLIAANRKVLLADPSTQVSKDSIGPIIVGQPISLGNQHFNNILVPVIRDYNIYLQTNTISQAEQDALNSLTSNGWILAGSFANNLLTRYQANGHYINLIQNYMPSYTLPEQQTINQLGDAANDVYNLAFAGAVHKYVTKAFIDESSSAGLVTKLLIDGVNQKVVAPINATIDRMTITIPFPWPLGDFRLAPPAGVKSQIQDSLLGFAREAGDSIDSIIKIFLTLVSFAAIDIGVLSSVRLIGEALIFAGGIFYGGFVISASVITLILGLFPTLNVASGFFNLSLLIMPLVGVISGSMLLNGAVLAFYVPLLPVIVFTFGVLGWLVGVFESLIAAPLVAIGIMLPEAQESFMGKASPAVMLLLNLFLRPTLMLFGLVGGLILANIGVWLFIVLFSATVAAMAGANITLIISLFNGSIENVGSILNTLGMSLNNIALLLIGIVFFPIIVMTTILAIVKKSFALVHTVPDRILRWLSGGLQEQLGAEMSSGAQEVGEGAQRELSAGKETLASSANRAGSGALNKAYENARNRARNRENKKQNKAEMDAKERDSALQGTGPSAQPTKETE